MNKKLITLFLLSVLTGFGIPLMTLVSPLMAFLFTLDVVRVLVAVWFVGLIIVTLTIAEEA